MYEFRYASENHEFEQIHRLIYRAFVEEIPQHPPNPELRLVDPFHDENTYAICLHNDRIVGMLALRSQRPFSLDKKLNDLDRYLPPYRSIFEIRLLYILSDHRNGKVIRGLLELVGDFGVTNGHDIGVISGTTRQARFYQHMGFVAFGPVVGNDEAPFQPMYLTVEAAHEHTPWAKVFQDESAKTGGNNPGHTAGVLHTFMPGPVSIPDPVRQAFIADPVSHRADQFVKDVQDVKRDLCRLVNAHYVEFIFGSATLANEALAAQLTLLTGRGVMLTNGEFGSRLVEQARCWRLDFETFEMEWAKPFDYAMVEDYLAHHSDVSWLWFSHCETSTGMLNDLERLKVLCQAHRIHLCVDCISSIGGVAIDLGGVYLATGTSGKSFGSYAGLGMVFYNHLVVPSDDIPRYLDIGYYASRSGVPFTLMSNLLYSLRRALDYSEEGRYSRVAHLGEQVRRALQGLGLELVVSGANAIPTVTTVALPLPVSSVELGDALRQAGYELSYKSSYLVARNWIQICLMGEHEPAVVRSLLSAFREQVERLRADQSATST